METNNQKQLNSMKIYHQKKVVNPKTKRTKYLGEDSRPFVNDYIIMVSDGLGGRGGYPHYTANMDILEKENLLEKLRNVIMEYSVPKENDSLTDCAEDFDLAAEEEKWDISEIMSFIEENFTELFEMAEDIKEDHLKMRTSGYFASRLLTASFLTIVTNPSVIDQIRNKTQEEIKEYVEKENGIRDQILERLRKFADALGLKNDSKTRGNYLLPATLTSTLLFEKEDCVEAIYLWAGDTRGYIWTEEKGLQQVTRDHEDGETMYNLFKLDSTPEVPKEHSTELKVEQDGFIPTLEVKKVIFKKPCFIFNTSDGIYKCHNFGSPLDLECTLMMPVLNSDSIDLVERKIDNAYQYCGLHDDSNTLAGKFFGYKDYQDFKTAVEKRMENIKTLYQSQMPDILEKDCIADVRNAELRLAKGLKSTTPIFREDPYVVSVVKENIKAQNYGNYGNLIIEEKNKSNKYRIKQREIKEDIRKIIIKNWLNIIGESEKLQQIIEAKQVAINEIREEYTKEVQSYLDQYNTLIEELKENMEPYLDIETLIEKKGINRKTEDILKSINELNAYLFDLYGSDIVKKYHLEKTSKNKIDVEKEFKDEIDEYVEQLIIEVLNTGIKETCEKLNLNNKELTLLLKEYIQLEDKIQKIEKITEVDIPEELIDKYWAAHSEKVSREIWNNKKEKLTQQTVDEVEKVISPLEADVEKERAILEKRQTIYDQYELVYNEYLNEKPTKELSPEEKLNQQADNLEEKIESLEK